MSKHAQASLNMFEEETQPQKVNKKKKNVQPYIKICTVCTKRKTHIKAKRGYCLACYKREIRVRLALPIRVKQSEEERRHKERLRSIEYRRKNRDRIIQQSREYKKNNPEKVRAGWRKHHEKMKIVRNQPKLKYLQMTPEELLKHLKFKELPKRKKPLPKDLKDYTVW